MDVTNGDSSEETMKTKMAREQQAPTPHRHECSLNHKGDGVCMPQKSLERETHKGDHAKTLDQMVDGEGDQNNNDYHKDSYKDDNLDNQTRCQQNEEVTEKEVEEPDTNGTPGDVEGNSGGDNELNAIGAADLSPATFSDPRHRHVFKTLKAIQSLRETRQFSDVVLRVEDEEFWSHRFVLSAASPFFSSLLDNLVREADDACSKNVTKELHLAPKGLAITVKASVERPHTDSSKVIVFIRGIQPDVFSKVMDYMYCVFDSIFNEYDKCLDLLLAAEKLQFPDLCQMCTEHIVATLTVENVFDVINACDRGCTALHTAVKSCLQVIRANFSTMPSRTEFLDLGRHHMISLMADSLLDVSSEMDTLHAALRWVEHKPAERSADLTLMLQHMRFPLMTNQELDQVTETNMLKDNSLASALVEESRPYSMLDFPEQMAWPRQNCISRSNFSSRDFLLWTAHRDKGLHLLSVVDGSHYQVASFADDSVGSAFDSTATVCCYDNKIIFTGGEFNTDLAWHLDSATGEVSVFPKMPRGRKFHSAVAMRGWVYCLGGQDKRGYSVFDSVDGYLISKGIWLKVGHLAVAAYNMTAVCSKGAIYMIGGVDHSGQQLKSIQCFVALRSGFYSAFKLNISNMPPSLLSARVVVSGFEGNVYIVCGHGEIYRLDGGEKEVQRVATLKSLSENPRVRFGAAHIGGYVVITGGHPLSRLSQTPMHSICWHINNNKEVKDFIPLLPADIVNSCMFAKLNSNILSLLQT